VTTQLQLINIIIIVIIIKTVCSRLSGVSAVGGGKIDGELRNADNPEHILN